MANRKNTASKASGAASAAEAFTEEGLAEKSGLLLHGKTVGIDTGFTIYEKTVPMTYGYIRVSTIEQNEARQIDAMRSCDCVIDSLIIEKCSGKDFDRPKWREMVNSMRKGDLLVVKSIDRLGRNYDEIIEWWRKITKDIGADIYVLDMPLLDTRSGRDLTGKLISDIVLQLLSYVAQTERENMKERQREGIEAAKARGVKFGRKPIEVDEEQLKKYRDLVASGKYSIDGACREMGVKHKTWQRRVKELEERERRMKQDDQN